MRFIMRALFAAGFIALAAACSPAAPAGPTAADIAAESQKLTAYLNAEFEEELAMNPMMLTSMGRKELYDGLGDFSEADADRQLAWRRESVVPKAYQRSRCTSPHAISDCHVCVSCLRRTQLTCMQLILMQLT